MRRYAACTLQWWRQKSLYSLHRALTTTDTLRCKELPDAMQILCWLLHLLLMSLTHWIFWGEVSRSLVRPGAEGNFAYLSKRIKGPRLTSSVGGNVMARLILARTPSKKNLSEGLAQLHSSAVNYGGNDVPDAVLSSLASDPQEKERARIHGAEKNKPLSARSLAFDGSAHAKTHGVRRGSSVPPPSQGFPPVKSCSLMRA